MAKRSVRIDGENTLRSRASGKIGPCGIESCGEVEKLYKVTTPRRELWVCASCFQRLRERLRPRRISPQDEMIRDAFRNRNMLKRGG